MKRNTKPKQNSYKFELTFFIANSDKGEKIEIIKCDQWVEMMEDQTPKIYCINEKKAQAIGFPSQNLRKIIENDLNMTVNEDKTIITSGDEGLYA